MTDRLTYKSSFGDYGSAKDYKTEREEIEALRNRLGEYEDDEDWTLCSKKMPPERTSIFAKFKGTDKWRPEMFEKISEKVQVTVESEDGTRMVLVENTLDGEWKFAPWMKCKAIAWKPLSVPYMGEL